MALSVCRARKTRDLTAPTLMSSRRAISSYDSPSRAWQKQCEAVDIPPMPLVELMKTNHRRSPTVAFSAEVGCGLYAASGKRLPGCTRLRAERHGTQELEHQVRRQHRRNLAGTVVER